MLNIILKSLLDFVCTFLIVYLIYSVFINRNKKEYNSLKEKDPIRGYIIKYGLDLKKTKYKTILRTITFINTLIISICVVVFMNIENMLWGMLICFVLIIGLIYLLYDITGKFLKRKEK